jgi:flagellar biosynthetic protein FlhB
MTRQELKEELKREEGDPHLKGRLRKMQRELAQRRMMAEVPLATVVVTNPTHLAVALRYERGRQDAPRVLAKGRGYVARRIEALARRHAVPVVENKPVARALFRHVRIQQEIPTVLYFAVAEVLAYVYRLRAPA